VWLHIFTAMGPAVHDKAAKHVKNKILCEQISRCTVARRIPGRFWKMGYHIRLIFSKPDI